jgi:uncharacterized membrane protein
MPATKATRTPQPPRATAPLASTATPTLSPPAAERPAAGPSGLLKAGKILLLVGAIVQVVGVFFVVMAMTGLSLFLNGAGDDAGFPGPLFLLLYGGMGVLLLAGAILGFIGWRKAEHGDLHNAWILGLVGSLLPPVQVVMLIGAILVLVSPEHEARKAAPRQ